MSSTLMTIRAMQEFASEPGAPFFPTKQKKLPFASISKSAYRYAPSVPPVKMYSGVSLPD
jgi:hypothetical protein